MRNHIFRGSGGGVGGRSGGGVGGGAGGGRRAASDRAVERAWRAPAPVRTLVKPRVLGDARAQHADAIAQPINAEDHRCEREAGVKAR